MDDKVILYMLNLIFALWGNEAWAKATKAFPGIELIIFIFHILTVSGSGNRLDNFLCMKSPLVHFNVTNGMKFDMKF